MFKSLSKVLAMVPDSKESKKKRRKAKAKWLRRSKPAPALPTAAASDAPPAILEEKLTDAGTLLPEPSGDENPAPAELATELATEQDREKLIAEAIDIHSRQAKLLDGISEEAKEKLRRMAMEQVFLEALRRAKPDGGDD